jgi:hypothetical protein
MEPITLHHTRAWVYSEDLPQGKVVPIEEANELLVNGWVDHPEKISVATVEKNEVVKPARRMGRPPKNAEELDALQGEPNGFGD